MQLCPDQELNPHVRHLTVVSLIISNGALMEHVKMSLSRYGNSKCTCKIASKVLIRDLCEFKLGH